MRKLFCITIILFISMLYLDVYAQSKITEKSSFDSKAVPLGSGIQAQSKTIEGVAIDSKGVPLPDGTRLITFLIYDSQESETLLWSEQQKIVIKDGRFAAKLGSVTPFDLPDDRSYWLGIRVGDGKELSPRLSLSSVADKLTVSSDISKEKIDGVAAVGETLIITFIDGDTGNLNLTANVTGMVTINTAQEDVDFRVSTVGLTDFMRIDASTNRIAFGGSAPGHFVHIFAPSISQRIFNVDGSSSAQGGIQFNNTNDHSGLGARGIQFNPVMTGGGNQIGGFSLAPELQPGANISTAYGTIGLIKLQNSSFNVTDMYTNFYRLDIPSSYTGTLTNGYAYVIAIPDIQGSKPTTMVGMEIQRQGYSGMTNSFGLRIQEQQNATNNWNIYSMGVSSRNYFQGNVGIGTGAEAPAAKLVVRSSTGTNLIEAYNDEGGSNMVFRVERTTGNVYADGSFNGGGADVAEFVTVIEPVEPGDVIEIDPHNPGKFRKTTEAMSTRVAGIITTKPGVVLGGNSVHPDKQDGHPAVALAGRVPLKVMAKYGAIEIGDLLVSSPFPGYAMKCPERNECVGAIIGKAMEPLKEGTGKIMVQVMLR